MSSQDLQQKVDTVADIEAIKTLKARYCYFCDSHYDPEGIASLFTDDGVWDGGGDFGRYQGREAIRDFFRDTAPKMFAFAMHLVMNPVIEVNGSSAVGKWYLFGPFTFAEGSRPGWVAGRYEDEYVKIKGEWKYKRLRFFPYVSTAFDKPWTNTKFVE